MPGAQQPRGAGELLILLHERPDGAQRLGADPAPLAPDHPHWSTVPRRIDQRNRKPAVGENPASQAAHRPRLRLHAHRQRPAVVTLDRDHAQPVQADKKVATVAVAAQGG